MVRPTYDAPNFAAIVQACVLAVIAGADLEEVTTNPRGPCALAVGIYSLDDIAVAIDMTLGARSLSQFGPQWTEEGGNN